MSIVSFDSADIFELRVRVCVVDWLTAHNICGSVTVSLNEISSESKEMNVRTGKYKIHNRHLIQTFWYFQRQCDFLWTEISSQNDFHYFHILISFFASLRMTTPATMMRCFSLYNNESFILNISGVLLGREVEKFSRKKFKLSRHGEKRTANISTEWRGEKKTMKN